MWRVGHGFRGAKEHTLASAPSHGGLSNGARRCTISPPEPRPTPKMESRAGHHHQQQQQLRIQCGDRHEPVDSDVSNRTYTATYSTSLTRAPFPRGQPEEEAEEVRPLEMSGQHQHHAPTRVVHFVYYIRRRRTGRVTLNVDT